MAFWFKQPKILSEAKAWHEFQQCALKLFFLCLQRGLGSSHWRIYSVLCWLLCSYICTGNWWQTQWQYHGQEKRAGKNPFCRQNAFGVFGVQEFSWELVISLVPWWKESHTWLELMSVVHWGLERASRKGNVILGEGQSKAWSISSSVWRAAVL